MSQERLRAANGQIQQANEAVQKFARQLGVRNLNEIGPAIDALLTKERNESGNRNSAGPTFTTADARAIVINGGFGK